MAICGVCKKSSNEETDVKCSGTCEYVFHSSCIKADLEGKKTRSGKDFKCNECRVVSSQSSAKSSASSGPITKEFIIAVLDGFKNEVFAELGVFRTEMSELSTSVQFISDKIDESNKLMESLSSQFTELKKENEELKSSVAVLKSEVSELRERIRHQEQYSRINNVEINGLPSSAEENICDLVRDVGSAIGLQVESSDIAAAHRVPSYRRDRDPALILQFVNRAKRDDWINKYRQIKTLSARDVNKQFPAQRVYINDHLCPENKQLLSKLKQKCREIGYSFAWSRDGKFFARRSQGEKVKRITCLEDILKLV